MQRDDPLANVLHIDLGVTGVPLCGKALWYKALH